MAPIISATMAPNDQMSIGVEYLAQPSRISGALVKEGVDCRDEEKEDRGLIESKLSKAVIPVPQGDHFMGINSDRNSKCPSEAKISYFDHL